MTIQELYQMHGRDVVEKAANELKEGPEFKYCRFICRSQLHQDIIKAVRSEGFVTYLTPEGLWIDTFTSDHSIDWVGIYRIKSEYILPTETPARLEVFYGEIAKGIRLRYVTPTGSLIAWDLLALWAEGHGWRVCGYCVSNQGVVTCHLLPFHHCEDAIHVYRYVRFERVL
jgi:hypothetical protein